jgi:hypothetical protein
MANTSLNLTSLDFDTLKEDFKTYLKSQAKFQDFDFEGSNMNILLTLLAHNTFKNSFYLNMVASESFLDSSQLLESVRSHAKELNYVPRSARSAKAIVDISFRTNPAIPGSTTVIIPKGTGFGAVANFKTFNFTVPENITLSSANNTFVLEDLEIYEGSYVYDSYVMNYSDETQRFVITNEMIDTDSLTVTVIEDDGLNILSFSKATTLLDLTSGSKVFFLQSGPKKQYEIVFGDDILGRRPKDGSIIRMDYRVSAGEVPNGAVKFSLNDDFGSGTILGNVTVTTVERAKNGADPEGIESVRYNAPRHFQVQERAVTTTDYEVILKTQFPEINTVSVYGGEEVYPPRYGKVFVAVDITGVDGLPDAKKLEYYAFLKRRSPLSIDPVFIEPEILYYAVTSTVNYNINLTVIKPEDIRTLVKTAITEFNDEYLNDFKTTLRYSKFITAIDEAHESIVSNETVVEVYKKMNPTPYTYQNFYFNFDIPLYKVEDDPTHGIHEVKAIHTVKSTFYVLNGELVYFEDDGEGNIYVVNQVRTGTHKMIKKIGTVDYDSGSVTITNFICDSYIGSEIKVYAKPKSKDISSNKNQILTVEDDAINITVNKVRE